MPTATPEQMLQLEGQAVGSDAVADPMTGRLPDVAAFRRAGVQTMTINGTRLTVTMLASATGHQRRAVRDALAASPLVVSVRVDRM